MLLRGVNGPCTASGPYSCRYTDAHRMFRCLSCGSSGALLTTFQSRSNLVKLTPVITPTFFSPYHRTFRCLGLAGPLVLFSLNPSAGPRVSLTHCFSSSRETVALHPAPVRRSAAATPATPLHCRTRAAPAQLRRRATRQRSRTRRACARATQRRPALPCAARTARRRLPRAAPPLRSTSARAFLCSSALLEPQQGLCLTPYTL